MHCCFTTVLLPGQLHFFKAHNSFGVKSLLYSACKSKSMLRDERGVMDLLYPTRYDNLFSTQQYSIYPEITHNDGITPNLNLGECEELAIECRQRTDDSARSAPSGIACLERFFVVAFTQVVSTLIAISVVDLGFSGPLLNSYSVYHYTTTSRNVMLLKFEA